MSVAVCRKGLGRMSIESAAVDHSPLNNPLAQCNKSSHLWLVERLQHSGISVFECNWKTNLTTVEDAGLVSTATPVARLDPIPILVQKCAVRCEDHCIAG